MWEILTCGARPYHGIQPHELLHGNYLQICDIRTTTNLDMYAILDI